MNVMRRNAQRLAMAVGMLPLSGVAMAHSGGHAAGGFLGGFAHPLTGIDHLVVMLAVGIWAAVTLREQAFRAVLVFPAFMLLGAVLGMNGLVLPALETGIATSVLVSGLLLVALTRIPVKHGLGAIAAFAVFHGNAHGVEMPVSATPTLYAAGFVLCTGLLHLTGMRLGGVFTRMNSEWPARSIGIAVAGAGAWMLLGL